MELRESMAEEIRHHCPQVVTVTGDCQRRIPYQDDYFDRVVAIHVLEHLPDLPAAMDEMARVLKPGGMLSVVLPGLAYEISRKISAERLFKMKYKLPYRWPIRREHLNSSAEVLHAIRAKFEIFYTAYFPLLVPVVNLNLCIGVTAQRWPSLVP